MRIINLPCACFLLLLAGCGGAATEKAVDVFPVTGTVTVDEKTLPSVTVAFVPKSGTSGLGGFGVTDASGNFTLKYRDDRDGVPPGDYTVLFTRMVQPDGSPIPPDKTAADVEAINSIPDRYNNPNNSPFTATVREKNDPFKFELKTK